MDNLLEKELVILLEATQPKSLRKSVHEVFFCYLLKNKDFFPEDFETIVSDFYFLYRFLETVEDIPKGPLQQGG